MLVNFPFIPESQETVDLWFSNLREGNISEEEIAKMDLNVNYHMPKNLTTKQSELADNTGIYHPRLLHSYQSGSLKPGYSIDAYFNFLPVVLSENKIDHEDYCEPVLRSEGKYEEDQDVYTVQKEIMMSTYGFVLNTADFMNLIGEQLKSSKRKFCVCFHSVDYHSDIFHKSGRLYHADHSTVKLTKDDRLISFHIFELLDENDYIMKREFKLPFMSEVFNANNTDNFDKSMELIENVHNKTFIQELEPHLEKQVY